MMCCSGARLIELVHIMVAHLSQLPPLLQCFKVGEHVTGKHIVFDHKIMHYVRLMTIEFLRKFNCTQSEYQSTRSTMSSVIANTVNFTDECRHLQNQNKATLNPSIKTFCRNFLLPFSSSHVSRLYYDVCRWCGAVVLVCLLKTSVVVSPRHVYKDNVSFSLNKKYKID